MKKLSIFFSCGDENLVFKTSEKIFELFKLFPEQGDEIIKVDTKKVRFCSNYTNLCTYRRYVSVCEKNSVTVYTQLQLPYN